MLFEVIHEIRVSLLEKAGQLKTLNAMSNTTPLRDKLSFIDQVEKLEEIVKKLESYDVWHASVIRNSVDYKESEIAFFAMRYKMVLQAATQVASALKASSGDLGLYIASIESKIDFIHDYLSDSSSTSSSVDFPGPVLESPSFKSIRKALFAARSNWRADPAFDHLNEFIDGFEAKIPTISLGAYHANIVDGGLQSILSNLLEINHSKDNAHKVDLAMEIDNMTGNLTSLLGALCTPVESTDGVAAAGAGVSAGNSVPSSATLIIDFGSIGGDESDSDSDSGWGWCGIKGC